MTPIKWEEVSSHAGTSLSAPISSGPVPARNAGPDGLKSKNNSKSR
jgi:hypothetical protein